MFVVLILYFTSFEDKSKKGSSKKIVKLLCKSAQRAFCELSTQASAALRRRVLCLLGIYYLNMLYIYAYYNLKQY